MHRDLFKGATYCEVVRINKALSYYKGLHYNQKRTTLDVIFEDMKSIVHTKQFKILGVVLQKEVSLYEDYKQELDWWRGGRHTFETYMKMVYGCSETFVNFVDKMDEDKQYYNQLKYLAKGDEHCYLTPEQMKFVSYYEGD